MLVPSELNHLPGLGRRTIHRSCLDKLAPLVEHFAAPVGLFHLAPDDVSKGRLENFILERCAFARPGLERGTDVLSLLYPQTRNGLWAPDEVSEIGYRIGYRNVAARAAIDVIILIVMYGVAQGWECNAAPAAMSRRSVTGDLGGMQNRL